uniref:Uncharacterized protein n=1 Tax=Timema bartmani TaxID=61472 RepID=A0A7R9F178_9NEOP|nr:unnamed protein product [Timema bartmani]
MMPLGFTLQELKNMGVLRSLVMNSNIVCSLHATPAIDNWEEVTPDPAISDVDFVSVYEDMAVCGEVTDVYIVAEVLNNSIQAEDGTSVDEEYNSLAVQERPISSAAEAMDHIQELRRVAGMSAIAIFVIFVMFGMKEKTYDEAIAEQRKMPEENLLLGRSTKDKAKDKKQKKAGKKVKEKPRDEREKNIHADSKTTTPHEKTHVEFEEPEAEFINDRPPQVYPEQCYVPPERQIVSMQVTKLDVMSLWKEDVSVKFVDDFEDHSETLSAANNLKHAKNVKTSGGKAEKLVGNKLSKLSGAKGEKEVIPPKQEKSSAMATPKQEKSSAVAALKQEKSLTMAAPKQEKSSAVAASKQEKSSAVAASKQEKSSAVAAPKQEKSSVVAAAPATVLSTPKLEDEEDSAVCLIKADKNNSPKVEKAAVKVEKPIVEHGTPPLSSKERSKKKRSELATLHQMSTLGSSTPIQVLMIWHPNPSNPQNGQSDPLVSMEDTNPRPLDVCPPPHSEKLRHCETTVPRV